MGTRVSESNVLERIDDKSTENKTSKLPVSLDNETSFLLTTALGKEVGDNYSRFKCAQEAMMGEMAKNNCNYPDRCKKAVDLWKAFAPLCTEYTRKILKTALEKIPPHPGFVNHPEFLKDFKELIDGNLQSDLFASLPDLDENQLENGQRDNSVPPYLYHHIKG